MLLRYHFPTLRHALSKHNDTENVGGYTAHTFFEMNASTGDWPKTRVPHSVCMELLTSENGYPAEKRLWVPSMKTTKPAEIWEEKK